MKYPLSTYWKAIASGVGNAATVVWLYFNDHGGVPNHLSANEKWTILLLVATTAGVYGKKNTPYPQTQ